MWWNDKLACGWSGWKKYWHMYIIIVQPHFFKVEGTDNVTYKYLNIWAIHDILSWKVLCTDQMYLTFWSFDFVCTCWRLLTLCVPVEGYWLCVYLLKVIDSVCTCWRLYHLLTLCVSVEGYWLGVYLLKVIDFVCTCWRLLTLCVPVEGNTRHTSKLDIYVLF